MPSYVFAILATVFIAAVSICSASAHTIPWRDGETRMLGWGHCAKGACMKRYRWADSKPHRHVGGKIVFDKILSPR